VVRREDGNGAAYKQYERIAFNGVTMMFPPLFDDSVTSLQKLCSEIVEKWTWEGGTERQETRSSL